MAKSIIIMRRKGHRLECVAQWEGEALEEYPEGVDLNVTVSRARSLRQNNTYWGLLSWVIDNGPEWIGKQWPHRDHLSDALQLELGFVRQIKLPNGMFYMVPEHKNFAEMSQEKFNAYFTAVQTQLLKWCNFDPLEAYLSRRDAA